MNTDRIFTGVVKECFMEWLDYNTKTSLIPMSAFSESDYSTCMMALMTKWLDSRGWYVLIEPLHPGLFWKVMDDAYEIIAECETWYTERDTATFDALKAVNTYLNNKYVIRTK